METSEIPESLLPYCECPASALSPSTRVWLSKNLNPEIDSFSSTYLLKDWRGVAQFLEFSSLEIENFARDKNPTAEFLRHWTFQNTATLGKLLEALETVERFDVLCSDQLITLIEKDYTVHLKTVQAQRLRDSSRECQPIQVDEVSSVDEFKNITVSEAVNGVPEYFDAFVCYTIEDSEFVREMMHKLETVHGLKLCIVNRDLMPGCAKYVIMAKLIEERCRKMIIVLSPDYIKSQECEFQTRFAFALSPSAKEKKLIPVTYRPCVIPSILSPICSVDYTRCELVEWFWERLANSLKSAQRELSLIREPQILHSRTTQLTRSSRPVESGWLTNTGTEIRRPMSGVQMTQANPSYTGACGLQLASDAASDLCRASSDNSLQETGSNTSWTDLSAEIVDDPLTSSSEAASSVFQMEVDRPSATRPRKKLFSKIFNTSKKP